MSRGGIATFFLIVLFLNDKWEPCHVIIAFFENTNRFRDAMVIHVNDVLVKHGSSTHILAYVKNEGNNLATMTFALTYVVSC
jgi:UDP-glucose 6-dehydrogenase